MPVLRTYEWQQVLAKKGQKGLLRLIQDLDEDLQKIIIKAAKDAQKIIADLPPEGVGATARTAFYAQQRSALLDIVTSTWLDVGEDVFSMLHTSTKSATNSSKALLGLLTKASPQTATLLVNSLQRSSSTIFEDLRSRLLNDINLSPTVYRNSSYMMGKIDDIVNNGIALGQSSREIADAVVDHINPSVPGGQKYAAQRLGRTELNNAFHSTAIRSYAESPWVIGVKWHLSGSHPKPDECNTFADENHTGLGVGIFMPAEVPAKPHPQCFCYLAPVTPTPDQFMKSLLSGKYDC